MMNFNVKRLFLLFVFGLTFAINSFAADWYTDFRQMKYLINKSDRTATLYPNNYSGDIVVPENITLDGTVYSVVALADRCFKKSKITSVSIPNSVKEIGSACFASCSSLKSIELPNEITTLPDSCFYDNYNLIKVKLPKNLEKIGKYCFYSCKFSQIQIPISVSEIGILAFAYCKELASIELPDKIKVISEGCFMVCSKLNEISLPVSIESMELYCFYSCSSLKEITIPNGVTIIPRNAFQKCNELERVDINSNVSSIGNNAFEGCSKLQGINCYAKEPPTLGADVFDSSILASCFLNVPEGSETKYKEAGASSTSYSAWKNFENIYPLTTTEPGLEPLTASFTDDAPNIPRGTYYAGNLSYTRTGDFVKAGAYVAQCLPFDIDLAKTNCFTDVFIPMNIALYNTNTKLLTLMLDKVDMNSIIKAGQPFVAKLVGDKVELINFNPIYISSYYAEQDLETDFKVYDTTGESGVLQRNYNLSVRLGGTYQYKSNLDPELYKTFMSTGQFGGSDHILPYRAYVYKANAETQAAVKSIILGFSDETTSIKYINTPENSRKDANVFTLDGRLINQTGDTKSLEKGIYIINGRKIIIK